MIQFRASSPRGLAQLVALELATFGATEIREHSTDVSFSGSLEAAYRACLWSRAANRIFLELARFEASDADEFYTYARQIDWPAHIGPEATLACDFSGQHPTLTHTHFAALKLKDAICDELRARCGYRPTISTDQPGVRVHAHARANAITVALDLSGESLHRRGYRHEAGEAPIKENLAAGLLLRSGWTKDNAEREEFLDPMCGSGTLVIEAAMVAADIAPALKREYFGFLRWRQHEPDLWQRLRSEATARARHGTGTAMSLRGLDSDAAAISRARSNAQAAGVAALTEFTHADLTRAAPTRTDRPGLLVTNPPYGIRLDDPETSRKTYRELGAVLRERFLGWQAAVLCADPRSGLELGIHAYRSHVIWNGAVECRLLRLRIDQASVAAAARRGATPPADPELRASPGAQMFANRLSKNMKKLRAWASRNTVSCYRIYDADMPEYALAIDLYHSVPDELGWVYVQEYAAPATVDADAARRRRAEAMAVLPEVCGVPVERIRLRVRRKTRHGTQYDRLVEHSDYHVVEESGLKFRVNFDKYLDTGLFLDMRVLRSRVRKLAANATFLNLFAYTGAATVYAAAAPARATLSIDLSNTYLDWLDRNLALNGLQGPQHRALRADCNDWLAVAGERAERFDLIFLAPPTFSNSKRMEGVLDIRRDHTALIDACVALLAPGGTLIFVTNAQRFKLAAELCKRYSCVDISAQTLPQDFERNPKIHRCFEIRPI